MRFFLFVALCLVSVISAHRLPSHERLLELQNATVYMNAHAVGNHEMLWTSALLQRALGSHRHHHQSPHSRKKDILGKGTFEHLPKPVQQQIVDAAKGFHQHGHHHSLLNVGHAVEGQSSTNVLPSHPFLVDTLLSSSLTEAPEQVHLSVTEHVGNVSVIWLTSTASSKAQVCWLEAPASSNKWSDDDKKNYFLSQSAGKTCANGSTWTYTPISVLPWSGNVHGAHMVQLKPGATYQYTVGDPVLYNISAVFSFTAPNLKSSKTFVAIGGDMGTIQLCGWKMAEQMINFHNQVRSFDAFWLLGDIAYSTLDPPHWSFEFFWDMFLQQEQSLLQQVPLIATYGNHDFAGGDSAAFENRFWNPQAPVNFYDNGNNGNYYFAYRQGPIFFVSICTERSLNPQNCEYQPGSPQYLWLNETLSKVNRTETPWVVVGGHRPMYSSDHKTDSGPLQQYLEPLLLSHQVDLELAGHMHVTEVTAPVANFVANLTGVTKLNDHEFFFNKPTSPVHITVGTLGAVIADSFVSPSPAWSLFRNGTLFDDAYGFATIEAEQVKFTSNTVYELKVTMYRQSNGEVMWQLTIQK